MGQLFRDAQVRAHRWASSKRITLDDPVVHRSGNPEYPVLERDYDRRTDALDFRLAGSYW